jgi:hypothetical protein
MQKIVTKNNKLFYEYKKKSASLSRKKIINYLENSKLIPKTFTTLTPIMVL